jgi:hypothetical protein
MNGILSNTYQQRLWILLACKMLLRTSRPKLDRLVSGHASGTRKFLETTPQNLMYLKFSGAVR